MTDQKDIINSTTSGLLGTAASIYFPWHNFAFATKKFLSSSTVAGIIGSTPNGKMDWLIRFDNPHHGVNFPHINFNYKFTGIRDPHTKISKETLDAVAKSSSFAKTASEWLTPILATITLSRLAYAAYEDIRNGNEGPKNFVENGAQCISAFTGGSAGSFLGTKAGAMVGSALGLVIGGACAAPLIAVGTMAGSVIGGYVGGYQAYIYTKEIPYESIKSAAITSATYAYKGGYMAVSYIGPAALAGVGAVIMPIKMIADSAKLSAKM